MQQTNGTLISDGSFATLTFERIYRHAQQNVWDAIATANHEVDGGRVLAAISQHLRILQEARLVSTRRAGRQRLYELRPLH